MQGLGLFFVSALLGVGIVSLGSLGLGFAYPVMRSKIQALAPEERAARLTLLGLFPWVSALVILALAFLPSFVSIPGWIQDHCLPHDHHPHLCWTHGKWAISTRLWILLGLLAIAGSAFWVGLARRVFEGQKRVRMLLALARKSGDAHILPTPRVLAFSAGFFKPRTLLSDRLVQHLEKEELNVVLSHEAAHGHRKDALRKVLLEALLLAVPLRLRADILSDFSLACEEICDRKAVAASGSPERVASVLLKIQRLHASAMLGMPGATSSHVAHRVQAILSEPYPACSGWMKWLWLSPLLLLLADPIHHLAETLLGRLVF